MVRLPDIFVDFLHVLGDFLLNISSVFFLGWAKGFFFPPAVTIAYSPGSRLTSGPGRSVVGCGKRTRKQPDLPAIPPRPGLQPSPLPQAQGARHSDPTLSAARIPTTRSHMSPANFEDFLPVMVIFFTECLNFFFSGWGWHTGACFLLVAIIARLPGSRLVSCRLGRTAPRTAQPHQHSVTAWSAAQPTL